MTEPDIVTDLNAWFYGGNLTDLQRETIQRARDEILALREKRQKDSEVVAAIGNMARENWAISRGEALNEVLQLACLGDDARRLIAEMIRGAKSGTENFPSDRCPRNA